LQSCELGGHTSRSHKGQSKEYKVKQETRERRKKERDALKEAKKEFRDKTGKDPSKNRT
jgi:hypothetical protein